MISDFYKPRWEVFLDALSVALAGGAPYNRTAVASEILHDVELPFTNSQTIYPVVPDPDPIGTVLRFSQVWSADLDEVFSTNFLPPSPSVVNSHHEMKRNRDHL